MFRNQGYTVQSSVIFKYQDFITVTKFTETQKHWTLKYNFAPCTFDCVLFRLIWYCVKLKHIDYTETYSQNILDLFLSSYLSITFP